VAIDYIYERPESLDEHIATLEASASEAREEAAEGRLVPGLDGPVQATEAEAQRLGAEITDLRRARKRIERGYPFWDRFGFEAALDACGEAWNWQLLSETVTPELIFGHDSANVRLPLGGQTAYRHAVDSQLFERFRNLLRLRDRRRRGGVGGALLPLRSDGSSDDSRSPFSHCGLVGLADPPADD
jgi:hypothetical protein